MCQLTIPSQAQSICTHSSAEARVYTFKLTTVFINMLLVSNFHRFIFDSFQTLGKVTEHTIGCLIVNAPTHQCLVLEAMNLDIKLKICYPGLHEVSRSLQTTLLAQIYRR